ncbi:class I SAM-dependent methyltransferase [Saccharophagus degradans]|uniref:class I SAM-dependent methyltransferase n=1 Tax=Saccharophagus degradans TaxID=86304 RepID=UPI001C099FC1|nr:class I SAM-dependent methyltransferase [Saccharophagus degradans]MBU2983968.1 class I SAM-dependent methyltransferase [Saccharophagus degradans]WGO98088.1 class I SAM-dependent methyltransferase [Saccharophagus degradans]
MLTIDFNRIQVKPGDTLLDLGCGEGRHTIGAYLSFPGAHIVGVDLSLKDLTTANQRLQEWQTDDVLAQGAQAQFICGDGFNLPFADHSFDHIICSEVLEHIPNYQSFFAELHRLLKPGGNLCLSVPRAWPERICWKLSDAYHEVEGGHVHIFKPADIHNLVTQFPYCARGQHGAHALHAPYWWLRCLFWREGEQLWPVRLYHKFLVWDLMQRPWLTRTLDKLLNPVMGKSVVFYYEKQQS